VPALRDRAATRRRLLSWAGVSAASLGVGRWLFAATAHAAEGAVEPERPLLGLPPRPADAPGGATVLERAAKLGSGDRDRFLADEICAGNVPAFLRKLCAVRLRGRVGGRDRELVLHVTPDYVCVGDDADFVRVPLRPCSAERVAKEAGAVLPTTRIVDAIYEQAAAQLTSPRLPEGRWMQSTTWIGEHDRAIEIRRERAAAPLGALCAGHKKDLVLTARLGWAAGRVAIYGWHRRDGSVIQPLSVKHDARYADYTHGVRLVSDAALLDDERVSLGTLLSDRRLAELVSDEGRVPARYPGCQAPHPTRTTKPAG
jgi:hypothetical protein